jgi:hypothetical protein
MLRPLQEWICDACGETIASSADGWLAWRCAPGAPGLPGRLFSDFRVLHRAGCVEPAPDPASGAPLSGFCGASGIVRLLVFVDAPRTADPTGAAHGVASGREYAELVRRLTVPYYEEARQYWVSAAADGGRRWGVGLALQTAAQLRALIAAYGPAPAALPERAD